MHDLEHELTQARRAILQMGATVEQRLDMALRAMIDRDGELARQVKRGDADIDAMDVDIERECLRILALYQPVATDLRFILAVMRINSDLERIADCARGIAKRIIAMEKGPFIDYPPSLGEMADATRNMVADAIAGIADHDVEICRQVRRNDQRVDDLQKEIFSWVQVEIPRHVELTEAAINVLSIARKLERIADLATNIAEDVIFVEEGAIVRHKEG